MSMTVRELRDRRNVVPIFVALYDDIELAWQQIVLAIYSTLWRLQKAQPALSTLG